MRRLRACKSVVDVGKWLQSVGITPSEHPDFGGVHPVHTEGSLHYSNKALDVNDHDVRDDLRNGRAAGFRTERDALTWIYWRIHTVAEEQGWPLDEMFFDGLGFIKERGYRVNHPIGGHDGHLHVGFQTQTWSKK